MSRSDSRFLGWIAIVAGILIGRKPGALFLRFLTLSSGAPLSFRIRGYFFQVPGILKIRLLAGLILIIFGIYKIYSNRENPEFWQKKSPARAASICKKIGSMTDTDKLRTIMENAPQTEVRKAAGARRAALMKELLYSGSDPAAIRKEVSSIVGAACYMGIDQEKGDFLAQAAVSYPDIVREFWPKLQEWAHTDSKSHTDIKAGFHTDRTTYYDYTRYPNGRTVANVNGRRRHTDTRGSYSDCHDDRHQDSNSHTDKTDNSKIVRFKPYTGEDQDL